MIKIIFISTALFLNSVRLLCQVQCDDQNSRAKCNKKLNGIYGLYDFVRPNNEVFYSFNSLTIKFDTLNKCFVNAGNGGSCNFYLLDSNKIVFKDCAITSSSIHCVTTSGYEFSADLFMDTLFICNRYIEINNEIQLYRDSSYKLTIKPYHELFPFPLHTKALRSYMKEILIYADNLKDDYILINSKSQRDSLKIFSQEIDFKNKSLVVVRNRSIFEQKDRELRKLSKFYKGKSIDSLLPVSYANAMRDTISNKIYLDIINTYTRALPEDKFRAGLYSGFIINKIDVGNLIVKVAYVK